MSLETRDEGGPFASYSATASFQESCRKESSQAFLSLMSIPGAIVMGASSIAKLRYSVAYKRSDGERQTTVSVQGKWGNLCRCSNVCV